MIIDVNASLGPYPFRSLRHTTGAAMLSLMDRNGIDRAVVSSLPAVFYRDCHRGNEELWQETKAHPARFTAVATVNPRYVGWERDLGQAVDQWKMPAVTLVPEHHGYRLTDPVAAPVLAWLEGRGVPLVLTQRFEDRRQRHEWDKAEDLSFAALIEVAKAHPRLKLLLSNWAGLDGPRMVAAGLKGRCLVDFARMQVIYRKDLPRLIETLGVEAIAFGSHAPFDYMGPSLVKLANVELLRPADLEAVSWRNAAKFLGLR